MFVRGNGRESLGCWYPRTPFCFRTAHTTGHENVDMYDSFFRRSIRFEREVSFFFLDPFFFLVQLAEKSKLIFHISSTSLSSSRISGSGTTS